MDAGRRTLHLANNHDDRWIRSSLGYPDGPSTCASPVRHGRTFSRADPPRARRAPHLVDTTPRSRAGLADSTRRGVCSKLPKTKARPRSCSRRRGPAGLPADARRRPRSGRRRRCPGGLVLLPTVAGHRPSGLVLANPEPNRRSLHSRTFPLDADRSLGPTAPFSRRASRSSDSLRRPSLRPRIASRERSFRRASSRSARVIRSSAVALGVRSRILDPPRDRIVLAASECPYHHITHVPNERDTRASAALSEWSAAAEVLACIGLWVPLRGNRILPPTATPFHSPHLPFRGDRRRRGRLRRPRRSGPCGRDKRVHPGQSSRSLPERRPYGDPAVSGCALLRDAIASVLRG